MCSLCFKYWVSLHLIYVGRRSGRTIKTIPFSCLSPLFIFFLKKKKNKTLFKKSHHHNLKMASKIKPIKVIGWLKSMIINKKTQIPNCKVKRNLIYKTFCRRLRSHVLCSRLQGIENLSLFIVHNIMQGNLLSTLKSIGVLRSEMKRVFIDLGTGTGKLIKMVAPYASIIIASDTSSHMLSMFLAFFLSCCCCFFRSCYFFFFFSFSVFSSYTSHVLSCW